jgi:hypothetical protein
MIAKQRKAHRYIWLLLSITIPFLLFFAVKNLQFPSNTTLINQEGMVFETTLMENRIVHIQLNKPIPNSSSVVYEIDSNGELGRVLGQIKSKAEYRFQLSKNAYGISVVDKIKNENIYTTTF